MIVTSRNPAASAGSGKLEPSSSMPPATSQAMFAPAESVPNSKA